MTKTRRIIASLAAGATLATLGAVGTASPASAHHRHMRDCGAIYPNTVQTHPGSCVRRLQRMMEEAGFYHHGVDGNYGVLTERAVRRIEFAYGLYPVNGVAGEDVQSVLEWAHENA